jgi:hypothetical protein
MSISELIKVRPAVLELNHADSLVLPATQALDMSYRLIVTLNVPIVCVTQSSLKMCIDVCTAFYTLVVQGIFRISLLHFTFIMIRCTNFTCQVTIINHLLRTQNAFHGSHDDFLRCLSS